MDKASTTALKLMKLLDPVRSHRDEAVLLVDFVKLIVDQSGIAHMHTHHKARYAYRDRASLHPLWQCMCRTWWRRVSMTR